MIKVKNNKESVDTWCGMMIEPAAYYELEELEIPRWASNSKVLSDIGSGNLIVNNGTLDVSDVNTAIDLLKDNSPKEVVTQFEKRDKVVKLASAQADVDANSLATILIKIPGTPNSTDGRWIDGGTAWFDEQHKDDRIMSVDFTDEDNLLGHGVGTVVGTYTDTELDSSKQGWRIPIKRGMIEVIAMGGYGFAPAGFYMKITGKKGGGLTTGTLYMNVMWGKVE